MKYVVLVTLLFGGTLKANAKICGSFFGGSRFSESVSGLDRTQNLINLFLKSEKLDQFLFFNGQVERAYSIKPFSKFSVAPKKVIKNTIINFKKDSAEFDRGPATLTAEQKSFIMDYKEITEEIMQVHGFKPYELLSLEVFRVEADKKFKNEGLVFFTIQDKPFYLAKNAGVFDKINKGKKWAAVESHEFGFLARRDRTYTLDETFVLKVTKKGELELYYRNEKDFEVLNAYLQSKELSDLQNKFISKHIKELKDLLKKTDISVSELLNSPLRNAYIKSTGEEVYVLSSESLGTLYFTNKSQQLDMSNHKKWGFLNDHSIGFLKGLEAEVITTDGYAIKTRSTNIASIHHLKPDRYLERLIRDNEGEIEKFLTEFKPEIFELMEKKIIDSEMLEEGSLSVAVSEKTNQEIFILIKDDHQIYYFTNNPAEVSKDKLSRVASIGNINTHLLGSSFVLKGSEYVSIKVVTPPGFSREAEGRVEFDEFVYSQMQQEAAQQ